MRSGIPGNGGWLGRSAAGAVVAAGAITVGRATAGLGLLAIAAGTRAERLTAMWVISGLGVAVGTLGRRGATVGFRLAFGAALIAAGRAGLATALRFAGAAAFFLAGFATLRRVAAAVRFLRAATAALAFLRTGFAFLLAVLALARVDRRAFFAGLDLRPLVLAFAAIVKSPNGDEMGLRPDFTPWTRRCQFGGTGQPASVASSQRPRAARGYTRPGPRMTAMASAGSLSGGAMRRELQEWRMEVLYFSLAAILLYLAADWVLRRIESAAGRTLEYRSVLFFAVLLGLALLAFGLIRQFAS